MLRLVLPVIIAVIIFGVHPAQAQQPTWVAPDDITELSSDDYFLLFCSSCTDLGDASNNRMRNWTPSLGGLPDVDTTGLATDDLLRYDGTNFLPLNIDEIVGEDGSNQMKLGEGATVGGFGATAVGVSTNSGASGTSLGFNADAGTQSLALGRNSNAGGNSTITAGYLAGSTSSDDSVFIGNLSSGNGDRTVVLGRNASNGNFNDCITLGYGSACTEANQTVLAPDNTYTVYIPGDLEVVGKSTIRMAPTTLTASHTLTCDNIGSTLLYSSSGNGTLTIPDNLSCINGGESFLFVQDSTGTLSFASSGSFDLNSYPGLTTKAQNANGAFLFYDSGEGLVTGDLE